SRRSWLSRFRRRAFARLLTISRIVLIAALPVFPVAHVMLFCHITPFRTAVRYTASALTLACGVAALSAQQPQAPQPPQTMTLVHVAELPRLIDPQLSPDGKSVAYMLATADWGTGRQVFHLWRQSVAGGAPVALTTGSTGDAPGSTRWSPDSA